MYNVMPVQKTVRCSGCMTKLDHLDWKAGIAFDCYGVAIGIRSNNANALYSLKEALPPAWTPTGDPNVEMLYSVLVGGTDRHTRIRRYHLLYAGATQVARTFAWEELLGNFQLHLQSTVAHSSRQWLFVKGGAVGWRNRSIVLIGDNITSPMQALVQLGATYISSPYVAVGPDGCVYPFPTAMSSHETDIDPEDQSPRSLRTQICPIPIGMLVMPTYHANGRWKARQLSSAQTLLAMTTYAATAETDPMHTLSALQPLANGQRALAGTWSDSEPLARNLLARSISMWQRNTASTHLPPQ